MQAKLNWNRAATCAAPAPGVEEAMVEGLHALPGDRGTGGQSTAERFFAVRAKAATMFGIQAPERVVFTPGATYGLNVAVHCGIADHSKVLHTSFEHNSMLRPLYAARHRGVSMHALATTAQGLLDLDALRTALKSQQYSTLAMSVASNTLGVIQPYQQACALAQQAGVQVILDLAQGGGVLPIHLEELGVSYAAIAGHKSLHGPRGIGLLFIGAEENPKAFLHGGTGTFSGELDMPAALPAHLEAGTSNYPGIYGLGAALDWLVAHPPKLNSIRQQLRDFEQWCRQQDGLQVLPGANLDWQQRLPILAMRHQTIGAELLADFLSMSGVEVRAGAMCAALALPDLGVHDTILRFSPPINASAEDFATVRVALSEALIALA
jgi:selenocysteine lyase/cysteine desulfurase